MRLSLIVWLLLLTFFFPMATTSYGTSAAIDDNPQISAVGLFDWVEQVSSSNTLLGAILVAVVAAIITPFIKEIYKVREQYLIPYSKWCISFSGAIHEFQELCLYTIKPLYGSWNQPCAFMDSSDIITHIWHTHEQVEEGFRWLSMFKKHHGKTLGETLDNVMDEVDTLWHKLEVYDTNLLGKRRNGSEFSQIVKRMSVIERTSLVYFIVQEIGPELAEEKLQFQNNAQLYTRCAEDPNTRKEGNLTETKFGDIINALNRRIPRKSL